MNRKHLIFIMRLIWLNIKLIGKTPSLERFVYKRIFGLKIYTKIKAESGFGIAKIRGEGKPIHPDDLNYKCWCEKCQTHYQNQLKAYNDEYGAE